MNDDFEQLRKKIDGSDPFMSQGHQIKKIRTREKAVPTWALSDAEIQRILLKAFPKLRTDRKQRKSAARWASIVHLFYRMNQTYSRIAAELKISQKSVECCIYRVRRIAEGRTKQSRGRPQKARVSKLPV